MGDRWHTISALLAFLVTGAAWLFTHELVQSVLSTLQEIAASILLFVLTFIVILIRNPVYIFRRALVAACSVALIVAASSGLEFAIHIGDDAAASFSYGTGWPSIVLIALVIVVLFLAHQAAAPNQQ